MYVFACEAFVDFGCLLEPVSLKSRSDKVLEFAGVLGVETDVTKQ